MAVNTHMPTNMTQPWEPGFDPIMAQWYRRVWARTDCLPGVRRGSGQPMRDWLAQDQPEQIWFYGLDDRTHEEWQEYRDRCHLVPGVRDMGWTTALAMTQALAADLLHELEIPGVWMVWVRRA